VVEAMKMLLELRDLHVSVGEREIIKGVNLKIGLNEIHAIMGPNASGKTTLVLAIAGFPGYKVTRGDILFEGRSILKLSLHERAKIGIAIALQNPPAIRGIRLRDMIRLAAGLEPWDPSRGEPDYFSEKFLRMVGLPPEQYLDRDVNVGFSGGERKRCEIAQLFAMKPKLMILDEPDSGVDLDSLKILGRSIMSYLQAHSCSVLVVTHHRHILQYLKPTKVHVIYDGRIAVSGEFNELVPLVEQIGYERLVKEWSAR